LASIADSFIYIVSRMGVTGSSANTTMSSSLPELCARVRKFAGKTPIAVGFGVNTREHFLSVGSLADGVVIGSKIVSLIKEAGSRNITDIIRDYCQEVSHADEVGTSHEVNLGESIEIAKVDAVATPTASIHRTGEQAHWPLDDLEGLTSANINGSPGSSVTSNLDWQV
jgi:tryptophan synthase